MGISDMAPTMQGIDGSWPEGKALSVDSASLKADTLEARGPVEANASGQTFHIPLGIGATTIKSLWYDKENNPIAGAYYLTAERLA